MTIETMRYKGAEDADPEISTFIPMLQAKLPIAPHG